MAKLIGLKNTTLTDIELVELGETVPVNQGSPENILDMSNTAAFHFRKVANLKSLIDVGDIVVFDGNRNLDSEEGYDYLVDDVTADNDGFWHSKRRRFSVKANKTSHGFVEGEVIYIDNSGVLQKAIATSHKTSSTAYVVIEVIDTDNFYGGTFGAIVTPNASSIVEGLPLTVGVAYFLSSTQAGKLTLTPPSAAGEIVKLIGVAVSSTTLSIFNYPGYENETSLNAADVLNLQAGSSIVRHNIGWFPACIDVVDDPSTLSPVTGDRYIVGTGVGAWSGQDNNIAEYNATSSSWVYFVPESGNFTYNKNTSKLVKFDGSSWINAVSGSTVGPPAICYRHNGSVTQTFTSSYSTILIGTDVKTDASTYTVSNNEVTVLKAGWYKIEYDVSADAVTGMRSSMEHRLEKNGSEIDGSHAYSYHRTSSSGEDTAHAAVWELLAVNDVIRIRSKELIGGTRTKEEACRLTLEYYG